MKVEKKVWGKLSKCYSMAPLRYKEKDHILVAAEKQDRCILFDLDGNEIDTLWHEPGGVMSMQQVPGSDGVFLATHQFYSQNNSSDAKIMIVRPISEGNWERKVLVELPFVHRFGILQRGGINYLICCTIKSAHAYEDDWSSPGKVLCAILPKDLSEWDEKNSLELEEIKGGLLKNHGFYMEHQNGFDTALVACDNGVYRFVPPENSGGEWEVQEITKVPASDSVMVDIDGDGEEELVVIAPFHGDNISFYKNRGDGFEKMYEYPEKVEFVHSIYGGLLCGKPAVVIGHRKGKRNLLLFTWNEGDKRIECEIIDHDCGSANVFKFDHHDHEFILSTNREIDEIACYRFEE